MGESPDDQRNVDRAASDGMGELATPPGFHRDAIELQHSITRAQTGRVGGAFRVHVLDSDWAIRVYGEAKTLWTS